MSETTGIEWTDATWNPVTGCTRVSPGCAHCYAERLTATRLAGQAKYAALSTMSPRGEARWTGPVRTHDAELLRPLGWQSPGRIFVCSMSDLFHRDVPWEFLDRVFAVIALAGHHTFQLLTKRPKRAAQYTTSVALEDRVKAAAWSYAETRPINFAQLRDRLVLDQLLPLRNVWLGTSVEDQARAEERLPALLACAARVRFVSAEPLLEPIDLSRWLDSLDWVIAGGETGPGARPCDPDWLRSLRDQCEAYGVPFFLKQMALRAQIPADLLVRGFPP